ncbi:hypothetical protein ACFSC4_25945 [Deinococcus malanensis]|uniref:Y-family DNA polymerase n=1 Tax=Deinococcus malanensis TaxID=1706855 RepID=UPI0036392AFF
MPVAVLSEGARRVLFASASAQEAGVKTGMRETAALSRCPELHAEILGTPLTTAAWNELVEQLYARYSDRVDGRMPGLVFLKLGLGAARDLAAALQVPVGLASSLEVAHLAALRARRVRCGRCTPADRRKRRS